VPAIDPGDRDDWREASRGFIARRYPLARTRAQLEQPAPLDRERWIASCDMGWVGALVPEELGGLGAGVELFADLAEEVGRGLVGDPFAGCALSAAVISDDPSLRENPLLARLFEGSVCAAWCVAEDDRPWDVDEVALALHERDVNQVLRGSKTYVLDADVADVLLVSARSRGVLRNVLVPAAAPGVRISRARGLDLTRSVSRVDFDDVEVPGSAVWDPQASERAIRRGLALGALLACADAIGAAHWLMEATVAYTMQREVFGSALAGYQAVKHKCADMLCGLEGSRVATADAARALGEDATSGIAAMRAVHVAKSFAGEACSRTAGDALQLHGGIGFTWEHDLHLYLRRVTADEGLFGSVRWHRDQLGRMAIAGAPR
jgi:alkylation response protein AidB-like acyl-CoA dehydrogenase